MFRSPRMCHQFPYNVLAAFRVLGLGPTATQSQIKDRYKKMVSTCHPDVPGGSETTMKSVNAAYELLAKNSPPQQRGVSPHDDADAIKAQLNMARLKVAAEISAQKARQKAREESEAEEAQRLLLKKFKASPLLKLEMKARDEAIARVGKEAASHMATIVKQSTIIDKITMELKIKAAEIGRLNMRMTSLAHDAASAKNEAEKVKQDSLAQSTLALEKQKVTSFAHDAASAKNEAEKLKQHTLAQGTLALEKQKVVPLQEEIAKLKNVIKLLKAADEKKANDWRKEIFRLNMRMTSLAHDAASAKNEAKNVRQDTPPCFQERASSAQSATFPSAPVTPCAQDFSKRPPRGPRASKPVASSSDQFRKHMQK